MPTPEKRCLKANFRLFLASEALFAASGCLGLSFAPYGAVVTLPETKVQATVWYDGGDAEDLYFANSDKGREAVKAIEQGRWLPPGNGTAVAEAKRPNIFLLYEQLTGKSLSPLLADELREAEIEYPLDWVEEAFRQAARYNTRSWAYVRKILEQRARRSRQSAHDGDVSAQWKAFLHGANRS